MVFGWKQWEENSNILVNSNRSDILTLLALLSVDAKSAVLLRVPSLTKVEYTISRCHIFPNDSVWLMGKLLCLCNMWKGRSYVNANVSVSSIFNNGQFYLKYYFLCPKTPPGRNSAKRQLLLFYSQLSFIKILKALQVLIFKTFWKTGPRLTLPRRPKDVIFEHII